MDDKFAVYDNKTGMIKLTTASKILLELYYFEINILTEKQIDEAIISNKTEPEQLLKSLKQTAKQIFLDTRKRLSEVDYQVPLYDERTKNLYVIERNKVYDNVTRFYYRNVDQNLHHDLKARRELLTTKIKEVSDPASTTNISYLRSAKVLDRLEKMLWYLDHFDIDVRTSTYIKVFYNYANSVGKDITTCVRPSFLPQFFHIDPYYNRTEIINLALNMELLKPSDEYIDHSEVMDLCLQVKSNDISGATLLEHQAFIINNKKLGITQYYSFQGSFIMNKYLRGHMRNNYKNKVIEDGIYNMWSLIRDAPAFDKNYILYRFINTDPHLVNLNIGDVYISPDFTSTTRDPFYRSKEYNFGSILVKIKIPGGQKGVGLCIESVSLFPAEEEILLCPKIKLRLDKKDQDAVYFHTDTASQEKIKTRYEFTYIGLDDIVMPVKEPFNDTRIVDFMLIQRRDALTIEERISFFIERYVNQINQFNVIVGDKVEVAMVEHYNSMGAYRSFFNATTSNGFLIYSITSTGYIKFMIEIGQLQDETYMYVNFNYKKMSIPKDGKIDDKALIELYSRIAYYFKIKTVLIFADYQACDFAKQLEDWSNDFLELAEYRGGNYCKDIYNYLAHGIKKYADLDKTSIKPAFSYQMLDELKTMDPFPLFDKKDEIYQVYKTGYILSFPPDKHNVADFYKWLVDNDAIHSDKLVELITTKFNREKNAARNPFINDYYILDAGTYLYNTNVIKELPTYDNDSVTSINKKIDMAVTSYNTKQRSGTDAVTNRHTRKKDAVRVTR